MSPGINRFKADLRDTRFSLFEQFRLQDLLGTGPFEDWSRDDAEMVPLEAPERSAAAVFEGLDSHGL